MAVNSFNAQNPPLTTKGDVFTFSTVPTRLGVGANNTVLTADSSTATGLKWAAPAGGKVLQVVSATYSTLATSSTTNYADTGLTASITPSSSNSKVLVLVFQNGTYKEGANSSQQLYIQVLRGATTIMESPALFFNNTGNNNYGSYHTSYLDSPATTSSTTYKTQFKAGVSAASVGVQYSNSTSSIILLEIGA